MVGGWFCKPEPSSTTAQNREIYKKMKYPANIQGVAEIEDSISPQFLTFKYI